MPSPDAEIRRGEVRTHLHENYRIDVTDDYRDGWDRIFGKCLRDGCEEAPSEASSLCETHRHG